MRFGLAQNNRAFHRVLSTTIQAHIKTAEQLIITRCWPPPKLLAPRFLFHSPIPAHLKECVNVESTIRWCRYQGKAKEVRFNFTSSCHDFRRQQLKSALTTFSEKSEHQQFVASRQGKCFVRFEPDPRFTAGRRRIGALYGSLEAMGFDKELIRTKHESSTCISMKDKSNGTPLGTWTADGGWRFEEAMLTVTLAGIDLQRFRSLN